MSIPPLVCSTPPPPDQCEDDKDPDDFDLHYNLSQEDDDENYEYGGFSDYNQFQSSPSKSSQKPDEIVPVGQSENKKISDDKIKTNEFESIPKTFVNTTNECKVEEEINIEDLNLNIGEEVIEKTHNSEIYKPGIQNYDVMSSTHIVGEPTSINRVIVEQEVACTSALPNASDVNDSLKVTSELGQAETSDNIAVDPVDLIEGEKCLSQVINVSNDFELDRNPVDSDQTANKLDMLKAEDSDFEDFDEFHCVSHVSKPAPVLESCDNPWASEEPTDNGFGDFKANFDSERSFAKLETDTVHSNDENQTQTRGQLDNHVTKMEEMDDDDFCDFEEFQSSAGSNEPVLSIEETLCQQVPFLSLQLQDNEDQFVENVNKVLRDIFEHEIPVVEQKDELGVKLESMLGEMWGHLLEIDTRQPYMVNWNNSLGQKTLLKSLCIDSRNILFGPKWNYNMPKYAANLSVAPLQPQKQSATLTPVIQLETSNADKSGVKTGTWSDPFNTKTQEFTYAEALLLDLEHLMATLDQMANNHSTVKISELLSHACNPDTESEKPTAQTGPIDLGAFEAPLSSKPDKIYSSTLSLQPVRQINLPDTHIFTPTDSETPRSKTIHYDNISPVLLPQTVIENKNTLLILTPQPSTSETSNVDTEYWDFQDFKSVPTTKDRNQVSTSIPNSNTTHGTQVLEPIKVESVMPTLNWPEPGEVKETFDDFSDFISNTTWNNEKQDISTTNQTKNMESKVGKDSAVDSPLNDATVTKDIKNLDDEFDTFQSALPPKTSTEINVNFASLDHHVKIAANTSTSSHLAIDNNTSFDNAKSNLSITPGSNISHVTTFSHIDKVINKEDQTNIPIKPSTPNILQPTIAKSNHTQQKSSQILQPLSLEGYSQINWPNPGIDLQDLSRFNPVETLQSLKTDLSTNSHSKMASPVHNQKSTVNNNQNDDDWGEFVSTKPKQQPLQKKPTFPDDDEWTDFISSANVKPQNGLNTISLNVHTNLNTQKTLNQNKCSKRTNQTPMDIPSLNYVTPKSGTTKSYNDRHFQNL